MIPFTPSAYEDLVHRSSRWFIMLMWLLRARDRGDRDAAEVIKIMIADRAWYLRS